jgi:hypothetical protein
MSGLTSSSAQQEQNWVTRLFNPKPIASEQNTVMPPAPALALTTEELTQAKEAVTTLSNLLSKQGGGYRRKSLYKKKLRKNRRTHRQSH